MKNACTYLYFRSKMNKLTDSQKFWVMNHLATYLSWEPEKTHLDELLEAHLRCSVPVQNKDEWWWALRNLSEAPLFYKILRSA
jgi:hypothetical protein